MEINFSPPIEFIADHPFLILLVSRQDFGEVNVLFKGRIVKPEE